METFPYSQGFHVAELPCDAEGSLLKKYLWGNCFFYIDIMFASFT